MNDHVAVLRMIRDEDYPAGGEWHMPQFTAEREAIDHALAAVAERDALVARLGELAARMGAAVKHAERYGGDFPRNLPRTWVNELNAAIDAAIAGRAGG